MISEIRTKAFGASYRYLLKPILFQFDPELMHNVFISIGKVLGNYRVTKKLTNLMFNYQDKMLQQDILGVRFRNPIGLAAGFDKNAEIISIMEDVGFGFSEVGSITKKSSKGNPGNRMKRLIEKESLWIHFGLNNKGADKTYDDLSGKRFKIPYGLSIAKTNCEETCNPEVGLGDYIYSVKKFANLGQFLTINISCPNAFGGQSFAEPKLFEKLMREIYKLKLKKPVFIKISPDLTKDNIDKIIKTGKKYGVSGFVCTNLTKQHAIGKGGLSGKAVQSLSDKIIAYVYKNTRNWTKKPIIIGVGGIFTAEDAYRKIKLGASLLQMITGMIYEGPAIIGEINQGLVRLLKKDGFRNIGEAIGKSNK
jgi:dihydroorotate dehydrogenase